MNIVAAIERRVDLLDCFVERAEARAYLWSIGEYDLAEAVDVLQHDAERDGLIERVGQDRIQEIIATAFKPFQTMEQIATQLGVNDSIISRDLREFLRDAEIKKPAKTEALNASKQTIGNDLSTLSTMDNVKGRDLETLVTVTNVKGQGKDTLGRNKSTGRPKGSDNQQVAEPEQTNHRRTPQVTVEAILYCVRERGIDALKEEANKERLARCDDAARAEIKRRIAKLREQS